MDIRQATYEEDLKELLVGIDQNIITVGDPVEEIAQHGLTGRENVNPADHPAGTWFYFPGDGQTYVREA